MVEEVIDEMRPSTQENGRDIAIAPVPIFATCKQNKSITSNMLIPLMKND